MSDYDPTDLYGVLGLDKEADTETIHKAYRKHAFELHPDRNPGDAEAEERFKDLTQAYAVLGDPARRRSYDLSLRAGAHPQADRPSTTGASSFDPGQFSHSDFENLFAELQREFEKKGLRLDESFIRRSFQGGRAILFGGVFFFGGGSSLLRPIARNLLGRAAGELLRNVTHSAVSVQERKPTLLERLFSKPLPEPGRTEVKPHDVEFKLSPEPKLLRDGGEISLELPAGEAGETKTYKVRISPKTPRGTTLRLPGQGSNGKGDILIKLD